MSEQNFEKMTVIELRKAAKDYGVTLGAGITKAGIIEKLKNIQANASASTPVEHTAPEPEQQPKPESQPQHSPAQPPVNARHAAILVDPEPDIDDDIPVLTPNPSLRIPPRQPEPQPRLERPAPQPSPHAANRPAFTLEGVRAWHNPRTSQQSGGGYAPRSQAPSWQQRAPQQRAPMQPRQEQRPAPQRQVYRFGPDISEPAQPEYYNNQQQSDYRQPQGYYPPQPQPQPQPPEYPQQNYAPQPPAGYGAPQGAYPPYQQQQGYAQPEYHPRRENGAFFRELGTSNPAVPEMLATGECGDGAGVLETHPDGYGFLRTGNYLPGKLDVYVSNAQIRRFNLRSGDYIVGKTRPQREGDRYGALLYITEINGRSPDEPVTRSAFEDLTPVYPDRRITLSDAENNDMVLRLIDLMSPIGFGQRAMVVSPPKAGKTTVLKKIACAIGKRYPDAHLMMLLVDERPEEVTDLRESVTGEVLYSTFDEPPENHVRISELVLERAMRLVEQGKDVVILLDSLTRLSRAYNAVAPQTSRVMSGGLAAGVLNKPKRFFGAARNVRQGGSLTVIATALVDTGSRMDDVIFEEFKGTGNMELNLDRRLSEKRVFPAVHIGKSGTRHEEMLLSEKEMGCVRDIRDMLATTNESDATEQLLSMMEKTRDNDDLIARMKDWLTLMRQ